MNNKRQYLIFEDTQKDPSLKPYFDACVQVVLDGTARAAKTRAEKGYPRYDCFRAQGREMVSDYADGNGADTKRY